MKILVTGGAGFIGSNIVDRLIKDGHHVAVYDNFSTGQIEFLSGHKNNPRLKIIRADIFNKQKLERAMQGAGAVFHLAANADVRGGIKNTQIDLKQNIMATHCVLEAMRKLKIKEIIFTSSAAIYGEPDRFPTPENYCAAQTSLYGASKLAAESLIQAYGQYYGIKFWIFRFVSFMGPRYTHGVVFDFAKKLKANPKKLNILGNGKQRKSYLHVSDGVNAIMLAWKKTKGKGFSVFNLGHKDYLGVNEVASIVISALSLNGVRRRYSGGIRGWPGDAPFVHLDTGRMRRLGWRPKVSIRQAIKDTALYLTHHSNLMRRRA